MNSITLQVDNSNIMASIENADLKITSPTNKTIYIRKRKLSDMSDEEREVFWKFCGRPSVRYVGPMEATREEMEILLKLSKL